MQKIAPESWSTPTLRPKRADIASLFQYVPGVLQIHAPEKAEELQAYDETYPDIHFGSSCQVCYVLQRLRYLVINRVLGNRILPFNLHRAANGLRT